jgi:hypothetical protein
MTARDALVETKSEENSSKIAKTGIRIRARAQDRIEDLLQGSHRGKLLVEFFETATVANLMRSALARIFHPPADLLLEACCKVMRSAALSMGAA